MKNSIGNKAPQQSGFVPIIAILIAVAVLAAIGGGWYLYQNKNQHHIVNSCPVPPRKCADGRWINLSTPECNQTCPEDKTETFARTSASTSQILSTWQTYRNEKYGFEVMYLSTWKYPTEELLGRGARITFDQGMDRVLTFEPLHYLDVSTGLPLTVNDLISGIEKTYKDASSSQISVGGKVATEISYIVLKGSAGFSGQSPVPADDETITEIYLEKGVFPWSIYYEIDKNKYDPEFLKKFLSTFKFTK